MGVLCGFCSGCWIHVILWYQKKMQFGIEMREHGALPRPTQELCLDGEPSPRGRSKGGDCCMGLAAHTSLPPGYGAQQSRGGLHHMLPMPPRSSSPEQCRLRAWLVSCCVTAV